MTRNKESPAMQRSLVYLGWHHSRTREFLCRGPITRRLLPSELRPARLRGKLVAALSTTEVLLTERCTRVHLLLKYGRWIKNQDRSLRHEPLRLAKVQLWEVESGRGPDGIQGPMSLS